jgi:glutathione S-transferase
MSVHNLYYYGVPGKAEQIRLALHVSGVAWENHLVNGESWGKMKNEIVDKVPHANIPLLEIDGQCLTESLAILRYVGVLGGLIPASFFAQHFSIRVRPDGRGPQSLQ